MKKTEDARGMQTGYYCKRYRTERS